MRKIFVSGFAAACVLGLAGLAQAEPVKGGMCQVKQAREANASQAQMVQTKLWEYEGGKLSDAPVIGSVEFACSDRGEVRADVMDIARHSWFSFGGPEGAPADKGTLVLDNMQVTGESGTVGLSVRGKALYGIVSPRHDCVFTVSVWQSECPAH